MVSPEYTPMAGGVGRYSANLTRALRPSGIKVDVVCNELGKGDFNGRQTMTVNFKFIQGC